MNQHQKTNKNQTQTKKPNKTPKPNTSNQHGTPTPQHESFQSRSIKCKKAKPDITFLVVNWWKTTAYFSDFSWLTFSRKRPRRVLSKKALSLNIVIKHCLKFCWSDGCLEKLSSKTAQSSAEVMAVFKDCHQRLPKVLLKWWLSLKIVIKDCPKFCWSDGCLERLSSKTAQSSAEVMAVFKDCHQRLPKVLLKWWLSSKTREKTANLRLEKKIREKTANLQRLEKKIREKTAEKDC